MSGNTILVTGGTSGIGRELAKRLLDLGNTVIVTGRDSKKLDAVQASLKGVRALQSDASDPEAIEQLYATVTRECPDLNILINNAGIMRKVNLQGQPIDLYDVTREIEINLMGPIRMVKQFLPHLTTRPSAVIINVSSGLAFVPYAISPIYSAAKAAIHSFTQTLRIQLQNTNVKVFEVAPPGTETQLFRGDFTKEDLEGLTPMAVHTLVKHVIKGLERDTYEIRPGLANILKLMSRLAPQFMLEQLGKSAKRLQSSAKV